MHSVPRCLDSQEEKLQGVWLSGDTRIENNTLRAGPAKPANLEVRKQYFASWTSEICEVRNLEAILCEQDRRNLRKTRSTHNTLRAAPTKPTKSDVNAQYFASRTYETNEFIGS